MADRKISDLTALTTPATGDLIPIVDISEAAAADKNKSITVGELLRGAPDGTAAAPGIAFESDGGNGIFLAGTDQVGVATGGVERVEFGASEVVFNDGGADYDFRIEGDTNTALFFVDASTDRVGVGTTSPDELLHVESSGLNPRLKVESTGANSYPGVRLTNDARTYDIQIDGATDGLRVYDATAASQRLVIDSSGRVGIGTSSPDQRLEVSSGSLGTAVKISTSANQSAVGNVHGEIVFEGKNSSGTVYETAEIKSVCESSAGTRRAGLAFTTSGSTPGALSEKLRITNDGKVGIGTTSVNSLLEVRGTSDGQDVLHLSNSAGSSDGDAENQIRVTCNGNTNWGNLDIQAYQTIFTQNGGEKARLDNSGRLLVGTSSTSNAYTSILAQGNASGANTDALLRLATENSSPANGAGIGGVLFCASNHGDTAAIRAFRDGGTWTNDSSEPTRLVFSTTADGASSPTERMRIRENGSVLIGKLTTSVSENGTIIDSGGAVFATIPSGNTLHVYSSAASAYRFYVENNGTINATNTTISAISDQRLKENIRDLDTGLSEIMALQPRRFDWKTGKGKDIQNDQGFIAQEFEQVFPEMIGEWLDPAPEGEEPYKSVRADLIPVLVKAIQEQQAIINGLEARLAALEAN